MLASFDESGREIAGKNPSSQRVCLTSVKNLKAKKAMDDDCSFFNYFFNGQKYDFAKEMLERIEAIEQGMKN
jgi:hypothetical protein